MVTICQQLAVSTFCFKPTYVFDNPVNLLHYVSVTWTTPVRPVSHLVHLRVIPC